MKNIQLICLHLTICVDIPSPLKEYLFLTYILFNCKLVWFQNMQSIYCVSFIVMNLSVYDCMLCFFIVFHTCDVPKV